MSIIKKGSAIYHSLGKKAKASVSTESGALKDQPYGFNTRFEDKPGTNRKINRRGSASSSQWRCRLLLRVKVTPAVS